MLDKNIRLILYSRKKFASMFIRFSFPPKDRNVMTRITYTIDSSADIVRGTRNHMMSVSIYYFVKRICLLILYHFFWINVQFCR